jgi:hypothetical protein
METGTAKLSDIADENSYSEGLISGGERDTGGRKRTGR